MRPQQHDTLILSGSGRHDTAVLLPERPAIAPGWYADPYDPAGMRYWDGAGWTDHGAGPATRATAAQPQVWVLPPAPASRQGRHCRSVLLAVLLAFFLGGLALVYLLPLPAWARAVVGIVAVFWLNWWLLLLVPLSWPVAMLVVPLGAWLMKRSARAR
jgi:hypothetical protein